MEHMELGEGLDRKPCPNSSGSRVRKTSEKPRRTPDPGRGWKEIGTQGLVVLRNVHLFLVSEVLSIGLTGIKWGVWSGLCGQVSLDSVGMSG